MYEELVRKVYNMPLDKYHDDGKEKELITSLFEDIIIDKNPSGMKSKVTDVETKDFIAKYMSRCPREWKIFRPLKTDRIPLLKLRKFALYLKPFEFKLRMPFSNFQKRVLKYFMLAPSVLLPNSWRLLMAFKALYKTLVIRPTPSLLWRYYMFESH